MEAPENRKVSERVATMIRDILKAEGEMIGCEECFELLDRWAELVEAGQPIDEALPEAKKHLEDCFGCSQELEALLTALRIEPSTAQGPPSV